MKKLYQLKKDLPTFRAGDKFELREDGCLYLVESQNKNHRAKEVMAYHRKTLEKFPQILEERFGQIHEEEPRIYRVSLIIEPKEQGEVLNLVNRILNFDNNAMKLESVEEVTERIPF